MDVGCLHTAGATGSIPYRPPQILRAEQPRFQMAVWNLVWNYLLVDIWIQRRSCLDGLRIETRTAQQFKSDLCHRRITEIRREPPPARRPTPSARPAGAR